MKINQSINQIKPKTRKQSHLYGQLISGKALKSFTEKRPVLSINVAGNTRYPYPYKRKKEKISNHIKQNKNNRNESQI